MIMLIWSLYILGSGKLQISKTYGVSGGLARLIGAFYLLLSLGLVGAVIPMPVSDPLQAILVSFGIQLALIVAVPLIAVAIRGNDFAKDKSTTPTTSSAAATQESAEAIIEEQRNIAEPSRRSEKKYPEGGFGEPYCSENCLSQAGSEIFQRRRNGTSGVCAFCQSSVYASLDNPGDCAFFPYKQQLFFICNNCVQKGKEHLKQINECCMCGKTTNKETAPSFVMSMSSEANARDTEYMMMLLYKERNNPEIPLEIKNFLNSDEQKGNLSFSYDANPSGGVNVTITLI